jgi:hypothetical protein
MPIDPAHLQGQINKSGEPSSPITPSAYVPRQILQTTSSSDPFEILDEKISEFFS